MVKLQALFLEGRYEGKRGLACWWWALSNGLEVMDVAVKQFITYDPVENAADVTFFGRDAAGRRMLTDDGFVKLTKRVPIKYAPALFGLELVA